MINTFHNTNEIRLNSNLIQSISWKLNLRVFYLVTHVSYKFP
jgi:hypothetical protein